MKKMFKNAILTCLFALCCVFIVSSNSFMGVKVNAVESENQETQEEGVTYTYEDEQGKCSITFYEDGTCYVDAILEGESFDGTINYAIVGDIIVLIGPNGEELLIVLNEDMTFAPLEEETKPEIKDEIIEEEKPEIEQEQTENEILDFAKEMIDYIIAFIVSLLGSGAFWAFFKLIFDRWTNKKKQELDLKLADLEEQKKINAEEKELMLTQFNEMTEKFNAVLKNTAELSDYIKNKIKVDEEKQQEINKLLEELLPKEEVTDEK